MWYRYLILSHLCGEVGLSIIVNCATIKDRSETIKFPHNRILIVFAFGSIPDALLADLQNTVPGSHLNPVNGAAANGTSGYGCLKGARRKEPQVSLVTALMMMTNQFMLNINTDFIFKRVISREKSTCLISLVSFVCLCVCDICTRYSNEQIFTEKYYCEKSAVIAQMSLLP